MARTDPRITSPAPPPDGGRLSRRGLAAGLAARLMARPALAAGHRSLAYRRQVQMIFQDPFGSLNQVYLVGQHIERPLRIHKTPGKTHERVLELLETVGLTPEAEYDHLIPIERPVGHRADRDG